jgi:hypothetical protein
MALGCHDLPALSCGMDEEMEETTRWRQEESKNTCKIYCFLKPGDPYHKNKKGNRQGMLKVIQHALTIANFLSDHPARLGIAIKMASIGEGNYHVVKK